MQNELWRDWKTRQIKMKNKISTRRELIKLYKTFGKQPLECATK